MSSKVELSITYDPLRLCVKCQNVQTADVVCTDVAYPSESLYSRDLLEVQVEISSAETFQQILDSLVANSLITADHRNGFVAALMMLF